MSKGLAAAIHLCLAVAAADAALASDWWDEAWPYRVPVVVSGEGIAQVGIDFGAELDDLGLDHGLLDLRSIRIVPIIGGASGAPVPYAESYSTLLEDADTPNLGWHASEPYWTADEGSVEADGTRFSQGSGSLAATIENLPAGYGYPGVWLRIPAGHPARDWSAYEAFLYDVWPEVNASALDQAPDLYQFALFGACSSNDVIQGAPPLALDQWNRVSVSLHPLHDCWPANGLNLSDIPALSLYTRDNETVNGRSGLWDDGDVLNLWLDHLRLVDQNAGTLRWTVTPGINQYDVYFDVLTHEGHPPPVLDEDLPPAVITATAQPSEAGGYYHRITSSVVQPGLELWAAPSVEKILETMAAPVDERPLRVSAARGELEPFQVVLRSATNRSLSVSSSTFTKGSDTIPAAALHRVDYVPVTSASDHFDRFTSWPDPLWPLDPGESVDLEANRNQPLWLTVRVPRDAAPGIYQATVSVGGSSIPVELEVWDFTLPRDLHLHSEWGFDWNLVNGAYAGGSCFWDLLDAFKQDFIDHRAIPRGATWPAGLTAAAVAYDCAGNLDPAADGAWSFAVNGGRYIHGEGGFNDGTGFPAFLSHSPSSSWPPDSLPTSFCGVSRSGVTGSAEYQTALGLYLGALDDYLVSDDYASSAYYHIVNEPQSFDDYTVVGEISALVEGHAPNLRQMVSEQVEADIHDHPGAKIDIWLANISSYEPKKSHQRQQDHGEEVWWYFLGGDQPPLPNPVAMSHPGIEARVTPWLAWNERVDGLMHYATTNWQSNPWQTPNVTGQSNGESFLFYPPRKDGSDLTFCGENGNRLVPSIRWENLRDGMEDYEYLWLLAGGSPTLGAQNDADPFVAALVSSRTRYSRVPTDLLATRGAIADAIVAMPEPAGGSLTCWALAALALLRRRPGGSANRPRLRSRPHPPTAPRTSSSTSSESGSALGNKPR